MEEIQQVTIKDPTYPAALKATKDAPEVLWYQGSLAAASAPCVAIVGTRRPSSYGQQAALQLAGELTEAGITIVSGLAPGIDTSAHTVCVERSCPTIAVLGTGLDQKSIYPQQNLALSRKIRETGGCLISEFAPGTPGYPNNFRKRNRIISALSLGVVVVEAKEKSGSLITARYAKEQQKKLFAIPGSIYSLNSAGPNKLIKEGATLLENAQDILDVLGIEGPISPKNFGTAKPENETEQAILNVLQQEALHIDSIIQQTKLNPSSITSVLALLEISGKIRNLGGNKYVAT
jgi:DNA processing protein